jgi:hypothetical protein
MEIEGMTRGSLGAGDQLKNHINEFIAFIGIEGGSGCP